MREGKEILKILENIIDSYELKVKSVTYLIKQTMKEIKDIHHEQIQLADRLKEILAKNQSLRKKDFVTLMTDIRAQQSRREEEIENMIEDFCKEEEEMLIQLRNILTQNSNHAMEDFYLLKKRISERPKEREKRLVRMLKNFHRDQEELAAAFRKLLKKGTSVRIKDLKTMIKAFHIEHQEEITGVDEILEEFERVKKDISKQWQKVTAIVNKGITASL